MTVSWDELEHWHPDKILQVLYVVEGKHKTLGKLGDTLDGIKTDLSDWGGVSADAWRAEVGKRRTDIIDQQHQLESVRKALDALVPKVWKIIDERERIKSEVAKRAQYGWKITSDGHVVGDTYGYMMLIMIQQGLDHDAQQLLKDAASVDQELADAIHRAVSDETPQPQAPNPKPEDKTDPTVLASGPVGGPDGNPPYGNGATATTAPAAHTAPLADNPPGYDQNIGPGAQRDQAWKDYLGGKNGDGTQRAYGTFPGALPKPEAVSDPALRTIGAAGRQQGVSYAWGANQSVDGPTKGHNATDEELRQMGSTRETDGSWKFNDKDRTGFDCGGLTRFAVHQGYGNLDIEPGTHNQWKHLGGAPGQIDNPAPGDLIFWGPQAANHTAINLGNGVLIQASSSGHGVGLATIEQMNAAEGGKPIFMHPH
ncbi:hypothetical protein D2E98_07265 [Mycobacteroides abscessus]|uniref:NlpC/P60 family protein n=1 Tax=Mycobacteroides abscessus TaxID=36809 RepID=UPI000D3E0C2D|nr:NlpC/P60 family protein [Mycobacteroides abscessus]PVB05058.1 hypothetical protein DDJ47_07440 [Mycobacteroides abscessus]RIT46040.1 hypothetical protein D2E98_07265 [Mycobacteroides abscessus]